LLALDVQNGKLLSMKRMSSLVMIIMLMTIAGCSGSRALVRRMGFLTVRDSLSFISKIADNDGKTPGKNGIAGE